MQTIEQLRNLLSYNEWANRCSIASLTASSDPPAKAIRPLTGGECRETFGCRINRYSIQLHRKFVTTDHHGNFLSAAFDVYKFCLSGRISHCDFAFTPHIEEVSTNQHSSH